jgi:hypothetical protein
MIEESTPIIKSPGSPRRSTSAAWAGPVVDVQACVDDFTASVIGSHRPPMADNGEKRRRPASRR